MINSILVGLIILAIVYYIRHINKSTVCNGKYDCNLYSEQDKKSACDQICKNQSKVYNEYNNGECICVDPIYLKPMDEHMVVSDNIKPFVASIELYTNIDDQTTILQSNTLSDVAFNNRDLLQKHEKDRYNSLIFG